MELFTVKFVEPSPPSAKDLADELGIYAGRDLADLADLWQMDKEGLRITEGLKLAKFISEHVMNDLEFQTAYNTSSFSLASMAATTTFWFRAYAAGRQVHERSRPHRCLLPHAHLQLFFG